MTRPANASVDAVRSPGAALPSLDDAMSEVRMHPRAEWMNLIRSDQSQRWRQRSGRNAEEYFRRLPELSEDGEETLVIINGEILLRTEIGEDPALADYQRRFPDLSDRLAVQFEVNRALQEAVGEDGDQFENPSCEEQEPIDLPGYKFFNELGAGSAGVVYRARQESLGRDVAVKVVRTTGADPRQIARQRQEAEILARLQHPNVVHIYEVLQSHGRLHLVMEFIPGATLAQLANGRPLPPDEAARLTMVLAEAMHAVHEAGVLHRDLKPSNVLMSSRGELKITDFGLAKLQSRSDTLTAPDSILGTPSYMAPEQAGGDSQSIGPASDVYSLGAIMYELLSGRPPFLGATMLETLSMIRTEDPVPLRRLLPKLDRDLETICHKCLRKSCTARYGSAAELAEDLRRYRADLPIVARPPGPIERIGRLIKRRPASFASAALVGLLLATVAAISWRFRH